MASIPETRQAGRATTGIGALAEAFPDYLARLDADGALVTVKSANDTAAVQPPAVLSPSPVTEVLPAHVAVLLLGVADEVRRTGVDDSIEYVTAGAEGEGCVEVRLVRESADSVLLVMRDVTERHRMESELRQASRLEALGRLSAGVAHEINTPIQFVSHNVEFMSSAFSSMHELLVSYRQALSRANPVPWEERAERLSKDEARLDVDFLLGEVPQAVEDTLEGIRRVATIVRAMRVFSHPSARELAPADINEAVRNSVVVSANEHKEVAEVELGLGELPDVVCVVGEVTQVLLNLIVNAAHALEPLREERGRLGRLQISTRAEAAHVIITVTDDGPGIPLEDQTRVFDPFYTTKQVGAGTGQGLNLARSIVVTKHGGRLDLRSEPGMGTTFEIRLPIAGPEAAQGDATQDDGA